MQGLLLCGLAFLMHAILRVWFGVWVSGRFGADWCPTAGKVGRIISVVWAARLLEV